MSMPWTWIKNRLHVSLISACLWLEMESWLYICIDITWWVWSPFGHTKQCCSNKTMHYLWSLEPVYYNCQCSSKSWALSEILWNQVQEFIYICTCGLFDLVHLKTSYTNNVLQYVTNNMCTNSCLSFQHFFIEAGIELDYVWSFCLVQNLKVQRSV